MNEHVRAFCVICTLPSSGMMLSGIGDVTLRITYSLEHVSTSQRLDHLILPARRALSVGCV